MNDKVTELNLEKVFFTKRDVLMACFLYHLGHLLKIQI